MHSLARVPPSGDREIIHALKLHFTVILRPTSGRKHQRGKIKWKEFQQYREHVLKRSFVNSIVTAKFDKCGKKTNTMFFLEKYPTHKKKFEECLELNS